MTRLQELRKFLFGVTHISFINSNWQARPCAEEFVLDEGKPKCAPPLLQFYPICRRRSVITNGEAYTIKFVEASRKCQRSCFSCTDPTASKLHIRLLIMTFFLQFFPDLVKNNHVYILQTPLFRVRNKQETIYCYSEAEKQAAVKKLGSKPEITRFKGLGEISPDEFGRFIGDEIRLDPVILEHGDHIQHLLEYYMGKNTQERQEFIINNLRVELDTVEEVVA